MIPIKATLKPEDSNPAVANLQDALLALWENKFFRTYEAPNSPTQEELDSLTEAIREERDKSIFGKATRQMVVYFQLQVGLGDNLGGIVERKTANLLNKWLESNGLLDTNEPEPKPDPQSPPFLVQGQITWRTGAPAIGVIVTAFDCDMNSDQPIDATKTDSNGRYQIRYSAEQIRHAEIGTADLRIDVSIASGEKPFSSDIYFNVLAEQVIDLKISALPPHTRSELDTLLSTLEPLLDGVPLADLTNKHIDFLVGDTGLVRQWIEFASLASRFEAVVAREAAIPLAAFYAWFRFGLRTDWEALKLERIGTLRTALLDAITQNIIDTRYRSQVDDILSRVPNPQLEELANLLGNVELPTDKLRAVFTATDTVESVSNEVLAQLIEQKTLAPHQAEKFGLGVSLHRLTEGEQSLVSAMLNAEFAVIETGKLQQARDLAALEPADWDRMLEKADAAIPEDLSRAQYARRLAIQAVDAFPNTAFIQRAVRIPSGIDETWGQFQSLLEQNKDALKLDFEALDLAGVNETDQVMLRKAHADLKSFANLHPGLGLYEVFSTQNSPENTQAIVEERIGWLHTVFKLNPEVSFLTLDYMPDSDGFKAIDFGTLSEDARSRVLVDLKAQQRIHAITNNQIPSQEIIKAGFHSASAIVMTQVGDFAEKTGLGEAEAQAYYAVAKTSANAAALSYMEVYEAVRDSVTTPVRVIPNMHDFFAPISGLAELISTQTWCECEHCQSVLSPAAYFVDLMQYIEKYILKDSFKTKETHPLHLQIRRPDLWNKVPLTCESTNKYIPSLDLVNEILEDFIADTVPAAKTAGVYQHIAAQEGSFKQPFTLPLEQLEILLGHFALSRYDIVKALGTDRETQVRAKLKLSLKEYQLITQERVSTNDFLFLAKLFGWYDTYNLPQTPDGEFEPQATSWLMKATNLAHDSLISVLHSRFVNGSATPAIEVVVGMISAADVQNNAELVKHLSFRRLDHIHRFVRLWRTLPWTVEELDYALNRFAAQQLPNGMAQAMSQIVTLLDLNTAWKLTTAELFALFDGIPSQALGESQSLFDRLFNQPPFGSANRWTSQLAIRFVHPAWKTGTPNTADNTLVRMLAGLQISDKEFVDLIDGLLAVPALDYQASSTTPPVDKSIKLTPESIGILYRYARLTNLLHFAVTDFFKLLSLSPRIATRTLPDRYIRDLDDVIGIIEFASWQKSSGFSLDEISYLVGATSLEGIPDAQALAVEIVNRVSDEKSLEFADTVFTQIGLTNFQSSQIVLDNLTNPAVFERLDDDVSYRLKAGFDLDTTPLTLDAAIDRTAVNALVQKYAPMHVLDVMLGANLNLSPEQTNQLRQLAFPLAVADRLAISTILQGAVNKTRLVDLLTATLRFSVLFKSSVFDTVSLNFVRSSFTIFFGIPNPTQSNSITTQVIRNVAAYAGRATATDASFTTASGPVNLAALQDVIKTLPNASKINLAKTLRTDEARISALKPNLIPLPANPFEALDILARYLNLSELMGVSGETLSLMTGPASTSFAGLSRAAEAVYGAFRAKYPNDTTFQEKIEPFEDQLRGRKRDGLVDFLITQWPQYFTTPNDMYEYFLIDVSLEGCARTSRLVAAISSLQLYVQRVLMNLEMSEDGTIKVGFKSLDGALRKGEWYWRKYYRVWEANRKVFLYPENYIEPELRDNKSEIASELEDTLLQQQISDQNVLDAYTKYLSSMDEMTNLTNVSSYLEAAPTGDKLHLFAVTSAEPPVYYHRIVELLEAEHPAFGNWTKMNIQIPVRQISTIIHLGRLYVFWVAVSTRSKSDFVGGESKFWGYIHKLTISYSALRLDGSWSAPQKLSVNYADGVDSAAAMDTSILVLDPLDEPNDVEKVIIRFDQIPWFPVMKLPTGKSYVPRYDTVPHWDAIEGYTLRGQQWEMVYPGIENGRLLLTLRNFRLSGEVDIAHNQLRIKPLREAISPGSQSKMLFTTSSGNLGALTSIKLVEYNFPQPTDPLAPVSITPYAARAIASLLPRPLEPITRDDFAFSQPIPNRTPPEFRDVRRFMAIPDVSWAFNGAPEIISLQRLYNPNYMGLVTPVNGLKPDVIVANGVDSYLIHRLPNSSSTYRAHRLSSNIGGHLNTNLASGGIDGLLNASRQTQLEESAWLVDSAARLLASGNRNPFTGAYGGYLKETFFHNPFLIANHLNSQQKFEACQRWYHYIFNPTASDGKHWRYREFNQSGSALKLRDLLTNDAALKAYRENPFNPHAIARTRYGTYQKSIVMKYIDNLLDWGDSLFNQFTMESINEATMLYVMAQDILGPRPTILGSCGEDETNPKTYSMIKPALSQVSDFLIELEPPPPMIDIGIKREVRTLVMSASASRHHDSNRTTPKALAFFGPTMEPGMGTYGDILESTAMPELNQMQGQYWTETNGISLTTLYDTPPFTNPPLGNSTGTPRTPNNIDFVNPNDHPLGGLVGVRGGSPVKVAGYSDPLDIIYDLNDVRELDPHIPAAEFPPLQTYSPIELVASKAVFCIPPNSDLLAYWGRVEDRLFKIRNCMDIAGIRRNPELFQPEIDPRLLVRMQAAGLTLNDVLNATSGNLPPYRFTYLIEKAKQYAGTLQSFGAQLLSAMEKKDGEELARLRAVHDQNLLKLRTKTLQWEIDAAEDAIAEIQRQQAAANYRQEYYNSLIQTGLTGWERTQQISRHLVTGLYGVEVVTQLVAAILTAMPDIGAPTAIRYGGIAVGGSAARFALASQALAKGAEAVSASAGLEATFQRRSDDWKHQSKLIGYELEQLVKRLAAAKIKRDIAVRALEVHQKSVDQTEEIFEFFRDKFSNLGLYTFHSNRLHGLYRLAYNSALSMARMAEQAYRSERTDNSLLLDENYWDMDNAGLLAGERLLIDLNNLERQYIETNYRQLEVEQSFSLAQFSPDKLAALKIDGTCEFSIPEWFFDLTYPGQYRRRLKAVRLTIPCVTGPYTNVGAALHLESSRIRLSAQDLNTEPVPVPLRHTVTIASSKGQYDAGVFDFSFRDERYMPFEGAGAISTWQLSLPETVRAFDYNTISDVVLHLSYTADFDETLKEALENGAKKLFTFLTSQNPPPMTRLFSLRHEFPGVFSRLVTSPVGTEIAFTIEPQHFPFFVGRSLKIGKPADLMLQVLSVEKSIANVSFTIGEKTDTGNRPQTRTFNAPTPAAPPPTRSADDKPIFSFDFTDALGNTQYSGFAPGFVGDYMVKLVAAGSLAPSHLTNITGPIDPAKLEDVIIKVNYSLA